MENPQEEIKKILSLKSWRIEASHYWSKSSGVTGDLWFNLLITRMNEWMNEWNHESKMNDKKILGAQIQFSKVCSLMNTFSW